MSIAPQLPQVRPLAAGDADEAGDILYQAFSAVYDRRGFRPPFPSPEAGAWLARAYLDLDPSGSVAAARGPRLDGVGFVHVRGAVASIGPVAARPGAPGGTGRAIIERLLAVADAASVRTVRLFQDAFNPDSFALYAKLGFAAREVVAYAVADATRAVRPGLPAGATGGRIRPLRSRDLEAVLRLDRSLGGADRRIDFQLILQAGVAYGLLRGSELAGFLFVREGAARVALAPGAAHGPGELLALVAHAAAEFPGRALSARVPGAPPELLRTLVGSLGFRVDHLGNLMVRGPDPRTGAHLHAMFPESL